MLDEQDVNGEIDRFIALRKVRRNIGNRWNDILSQKGVKKASEFKDMVSGTQAVLNEFIEVHGDSIAFAPVPPDVKKMLDDQDQGLQMVESQPDDVSQHQDAGSTTSRTSKGTLIPHEFRFLQHQDRSVWTIIKAAF